MTLPIDFDQTSQLQEQNRGLREALSELLEFTWAIRDETAGGEDYKSTEARQAEAKAKAVLAQTQETKPDNWTPQTAWELALSTVEHLQETQKQLTDDQRVDLWDTLRQGYCEWCGGKTLPCFCECDD